MPEKDRPEETKALKQTEKRLQQRVSKRPVPMTYSIPLTDPWDWYVFIHTLITIIFVALHGSVKKTVRPMDPSWKWLFYVGTQTSKNG